MLSSRCIIKLYMYMRVVYIYIYNSVQECNSVCYPYPVRSNCLYTATCPYKVTHTNPCWAEQVSS